MNLGRELALSNCEGKLTQDIRKKTLIDIKEGLRVRILDNIALSRIPTVTPAFTLRQALYTKNMHPLYR